MTGLTRKSFLILFFKKELLTFLSALSLLTGDPASNQDIRVARH
jgi:hypothetical protein